MKKLLMLTLLGMAAMQLVAEPPKYNESEWKIRPWEIIRGLQPRSELLWHADQGDLAKWTATNGGVLSETAITKLWGNKVAKLTFPRGGSVTVKPPVPLVIKEKVDGIDFYMYGPLNGSTGALPDTTVDIVDANKRRYRVKLNGGGSRWAGNRWWGATSGYLPEGLQYPVKINSIRFSKLTTRIKDDFLCFDRIGVWKRSTVNYDDSSKRKNPFPLTEDSIMPIAMAKDAANTVTRKGNSVIFEYKASDGVIAYQCTPASGTLSDIICTFNGKTFKPANGGGIHAEVDQVKFSPNAPGMKKELLKCEVKDNKLFTVWRWTLQGKKFEFELNYRIKGKSLAIEAKSLTAGAVAFDCGATDGTRNARLFNLGYLNNRWNYARMLVCDDGFMSVFLDWYKSNGSELFEGNSRRDIKGAAVISKDSARLMGGSNYLPLTNGKYNPLYEIMYITVSGEMHDIMPVIPNPPSRFLAETGKLIYSTRSYPLTGYADDVDSEVNFWKKMNAYGATDLFVRYHSALLRAPLWSQHIALQLEGSIQNGGYPTVRKFSDEVRKHVKRLGFYDDNRVLTFFSKQFDYAKLAMNSNSVFLPGYDGTFRPKSSVQLELQRKHVPELRKLYPALNAQYLDELSNAPPWADVDFDALVPEAGKFSTVVRDYGLVALQQKELFNGPIWSEGCAAYFWAGLLDVDYAQSNQRGVIPIVDFKLKRINPLATYVGLTLGDLSKRDVNYLVTYQIAFANSGHLAQSGEGSLPYMGKLKNIKNIRPVLKSYFMMRQLQEHYSGQIPEEIKYFINGKFMTASEMLKGNHTNSGKIYVKYPNGLEVWCNLGDKEPWTVNVDGEEYVLPVNGHAACIPDVLLQYSAIIDGHRADYSRGALYTYLDGCGQTTKFPEVTAANAYLLTSQQKSIKLTPVPFIAAETLKGLSALTAQPQKEDGTPAGSKMTLDIIDEGQANIAIDGKAFSYILQ